MAVTVAVAVAVAVAVGAEVATVFAVPVADAAGAVVFATVAVGVCDALVGEDVGPVVAPSVGDLLDGDSSEHDAETAAPVMIAAPSAY